MKAFPDVKLVTKPAMQWEPTNAANVAQDPIRTAINLLGMPPQYTQMIQGALVLAAMTLDSFKQIIRVRYL
jgi:ribose/xylose/arabinose/galactoside ABC-type transport system permease subunit